eukprot:TRINITY_DN52232_c0_g1_i1.p1 TRINITY_DN52232_c0_g1~~TRINITY_DN52232_c0_g1_i1.p1  ORF type:complete len:196 (-),score=16.38 TRINITY_DN52232_c0_g1_i1:65-580(-)
MPQQQQQQAQFSTKEGSPFIKGLAAVGLLGAVLGGVFSARAMRTGTAAAKSAGKAASGGSRWAGSEWVAASEESAKHWHKGRQVIADYRSRHHPAGSAAAVDAEASAAMGAGSPDSGLHKPGDPRQTTAEGSAGAATRSSSDPSHASSKVQNEHAKEDLSDTTERSKAPPA